MEALADKVHKQGEHISRNIATFHTTIPTYVAVNIDSVPTSMSLCKLLQKIVRQLIKTFQ